ncbi:MAG: hypothetical protein PF484_03895 [Bacteroidales bacterium]|jgi:phosphate transport system protein|nr:hypothetical protein [Bacteroidales bacterium]
MALQKDNALNDIQTDFETLANLLMEQLDLLLQIINSEEIVVADDVLKKIEQNEREIDKREVKLSNKIVNTIVLYHPVASDLRRIIACYRIILNLERISDLVINITKFIKKIKKPDVYLKLHELLLSMTEMSVKMVQKAVLSYVNNDIEFAHWTVKNDEIFEEYNHKLLKKIFAKINTAEYDKQTIMSIINIKEMMSTIERIADHSTNIAEAAIYSIEGKDIRHIKLEE